MKRLLSVSLVALFATSAAAGEMVAGTSYYLKDVKTWKTGDYSGYWMQNNKGISEAKTGPLPTAPVECNGAGFWTGDSISGSGICIYGEGKDTWIFNWSVDEDQYFQSRTIEGYLRTGKWEVASGTGKYLGMTGSGTYMSKDLPGKRQITMWEGEVEFIK